MVVAVPLLSWGGQLAVMQLAAPVLTAGVACAVVCDMFLTRQQRPRGTATLSKRGPIWLPT